MASSPQGQAVPRGLASSPPSRRVSGHAVADSVWSVVAVGYGLGNLVFNRAVAIALEPFVRPLRRGFFDRPWPPALCYVVSCGAPFGLVMLSGPIRWSSVIDGRPLAFLQLAVCLLLLAVVRVAADQLNLNPPTFAAIEAHNESHWPERWFAANVHKPIDAYFVRMLVNNTAVLLPAWIVVLAWELNPFTVLLFLSAQGAVGLQGETIDHTNLHNHVFRPARHASRRARWVLRATDIYVQLLLNPLISRIPWWYVVQHRYVHHIESNAKADVQSTVGYDRTSFVDYCRFALQQSLSLVFAVDVWRWVRAYRRPRVRSTMTRQLGSGMVLWYGSLAVIAAVQWPAALLIWLTRFRVGMDLAMNAIRWHGFVDPHDPGNLYRSNTDIHNPAFSNEHGYFGSDFHLTHHLYPALHWTNAPAKAKSQTSACVAQGSLRLTWGETLLEPLPAMWRRDYGAIAERLVPIAGDERSPQTLLATIEERLRPVDPRARNDWGLAVDRSLGRWTRHLDVDLRSFAV